MARGVAVYDWPHNEEVPRKIDDAVSRGKLIGHAEGTYWLQPTESLPRTFGGNQRVTPSPTEPPVLILPNWTPKIATPINLAPQPNPTIMPLYEVIYCLVDMFGGAVHIDQRQWVEAEPSQVRLQQVHDPWMMQVTIPQKSI